MITALDTNVLLDILTGDQRFQESSLRAVERAATDDSVQGWRMPRSRQILRTRKSLMSLCRGMEECL